MSELPDFQRQQLQLAETIRKNTGELEGIEPRRIKIYQDLFFNNVEGFCSSAFPVFKSLISEPDWLELVRAFFVNHHCETPHFCEIAQEFLEFLFEHYAEQLPYPYMLELAHYEWAELASSVAITERNTKPQTQDFQLEQSYFVPESVMALSYQYPVHTISADNAKSVEPSPTSLIVYRDFDQDVQFMLVDPLSIVSLQLLNQAQEQEQTLSVSQLINQINQLNPNLSVEQLNEYMNQAIPKYLSVGILIPS